MTRAGAGGKKNGTSVNDRERMCVGVYFLLHVSSPAIRALRTCEELLRLLGEVAASRVGSSLGAEHRDATYEVGARAYEVVRDLGESFWESLLECLCETATGLMNCFYDFYMRLWAGYGLVARVER